MAVLYRTARIFDSGQSLMVGSFFLLDENSDEEQHLVQGRPGHPPHRPACPEVVGTGTIPLPDMSHDEQGDGEYYK